MKLSFKLGIMGLVVFVSVTLPAIVLIAVASSPPPPPPFNTKDVSKAPSPLMGPEE